MHKKTPQLIPLIWVDEMQGKQRHEWQAAFTNRIVDLIVRPTTQHVYPLTRSINDQVFVYVLCTPIRKEA